MMVIEMNIVKRLDKRSGIICVFETIFCWDKEKKILGRNGL